MQLRASKAAADAAVLRGWRWEGQTVGENKAYEERLTRELEDERRHRLGARGVAVRLPEDTARARFRLRRHEVRGLGARH